MDRKLWTERLWAADMSATAFKIAHALLRFVNKAGVCWPSRATLAAAAGCSESSVERATSALKSLGLLVWETRRCRWNRMETNRYRLTLPQGLREPGEPAEPKKDKAFRGSSPIMTNGSLAAPVAGALARLGAALGVAADRVMPWLARVGGT